MAAPVSNAVASAPPPPLAPLHQFKPSDFNAVIQGKDLGSGSFGTVKVGLLPDGRYVAVKTIAINPEDANADNTEIRTHASLSHPNIVRYIHSVVQRPPGEEPKLVVFLELVTGGSVTSIMKGLPGQRLPVSVARAYARHMMKGLAYLHGKAIAHRDLKGDNLLVSTETGVAKIADFDQAKTFEKFTAHIKKANQGPSTGTISGTPFWMAPEVIENGEKGYDPFKSDIWAAGCTVVEMLTGRPAWEPMSNMIGVLYKIARCTGWPDAVPKSDPIFQEPTLKDFLDKVFNKDPTKRPTAEELLQHPYLKE